MRRIKAMLATVAAATALSVAVAEPAAAATVAGRYVTTNFPSNTKGYIQWTANDCQASGGLIQPGSDAFIQEVGVSGVTQMKVQYIYQIPNYTGGYSTYLQSPVYASATFPNNSLNYYYNAPAHRFGQFVAPDGGRLVVKFTFSRPWPAPDTNIIQAAAYC